MLALFQKLENIYAGIVKKQSEIQLRAKFCNRIIFLKKKRKKKIIFSLTKKKLKKKKRGDSYWAHPPTDPLYNVSPR